jgi:hypothetical protein
MTGKPQEAPRDSAGLGEFFEQVKLELLQKHRSFKRVVGLKMQKNGYEKAGEDHRWSRCPTNQRLKLLLELLVLEDNTKGGLVGSVSLLLTETLDTSGKKLALVFDDLSVGHSFDNIN